jgi:3-oxoacyl-[acyl-carrier protein] reductase
VTTNGEAGVVLVTGGSRGIGRAIALRAARLGCSVAVHYRGSHEAAEETLALCRTAAASTGQRFASFAVDLAQQASRAGLLARVLDAFGRVDALVLNAGMAPRERVDMTETGEASFEEVLQTNLHAPFFLAQQCARHWLHAAGDARPASDPRPPGGRSIVFIGSISAEQVSLNRPEYCIAKAGLAMTAQLWARRLAAHGVAVVEVRPGIIDTDMTARVREQYSARIDGGLVPQRRWGAPDDVARAVEAVLAGSFPFSPGAVLHVDGGLHIATL